MKGMGWLLIVVGGLLILAGGLCSLTLVVEQLSDPAGVTENLGTFIQALIFCPSPLMAVGLASLVIGRLIRRSAQKRSLESLGRFPAEKMTDVTVPVRSRYSKPNTCCVCGAPAGGHKHEVTLKTVIGKYRDGLQRYRRIQTLTFHFPLCDLCAHPKTRQERKRVSRAVQVQFTEDLLGHYTFTFTNEQFADLFKQMNERVDDDELWRVLHDRPPGI